MSDNKREQNFIVQYGRLQMNLEEVSMVGILNNMF